MDAVRGAFAWRGRPIQKVEVCGVVTEIKVKHGTKKNNEGWVRCGCLTSEYYTAPQHHSTTALHCSTLPPVYYTNVENL